MNCYLKEIFELKLDGEEEIQLTEKQKKEIIS
jgi:hypothetical protein